MQQRLARMRASSARSSSPVGETTRLLSNISSTVDSPLPVAAPGPRRSSSPATVSVRWLPPKRAGFAGAVAIVPVPATVSGRSMVPPVQLKAPFTTTGPGPLTVTSVPAPVMSVRACSVTGGTFAMDRLLAEAPLMTTESPVDGTWAGDQLAGSFQLVDDVPVQVMVVAATAGTGTPTRSAASRVTARGTSERARIGAPGCGGTWHPSDPRAAAPQPLMPFQAICGDHVGEAGHGTEGPNTTAPWTASAGTGSPLISMPARWRSRVRIV